MIEKLENYLKRQTYSKNFLGCSYYIYSNKEEYVGSVGKCNVNDKFNVNNLIDVLVINILIAILIEQKEISLNDKVSKYIDDFEYDDVLIIHLLTHSSGVVNKLNSKKFAAGSNVKINDVNYKILRKIIEKIYNTDIELLARSFIFEPLKMNDTRLIKNHVSSTINDISHFAKMIIKDGYYNRKQVIDMKYIDTWFTPLFIGNDNIRTTAGWIYGPSTSLCENIGCSNNTIVFDKKNYILVDRDNELVIVLLFNNLINDDKRSNLNKYIYRLLNEYKKLY